MTALLSVLQQQCSRYLVAALLVLVVPTTGIAQEVTLRFANGQDSLSGILRDFRDGKFFIDGSIGLVAIPTDGVVCVGDACPAETRLQIENADVVLTSKDGTMFITGGLIEIDNGEYVIATVIGEQRIATNLVDCKGQGCLAVSAAPSRDRTVTLTAGDVTLEGMLIRFANGTYVLDHPVLGEMTLSAGKFDCSGPGCP